MDAFEQVVAEILWNKGYWVRTSVKVELTPEEKKLVGRPTAPRWELDVVGYRAFDNQLMVLECKSFLNSPGVSWDQVFGVVPSTRYKLFREPVLRETVLNRLCKQFEGKGMCASNVSAQLGMAAGNVYRNEEDRFVKSFDQEDWAFFGPKWLKQELEILAKGRYENQLSSVVAKLLR